MTSPVVVEGKVANTEQLAGPVLANEHTIAHQGLGDQFSGCDVAQLDTGFAPRERGGPPGPRRRGGAPRARPVTLAWKG